MMKNVFFLFYLKSSFCSHGIQILVLTFGDVEKRFDEKVKVNFKIYDVTTYFTNNCNMHIDRYLKNQRQPDNEIWSVNRI